MKRCITHVIVLLLASALVSCGGGGDDGGGSGSTPSAPVGGDPGAPGSNPGTQPGGGDPGNGGGDPGNGGGTEPLPSAGALVEESDAAVSLGSGWTPSDPRWGWSGGTAVQSTVAGTLASFTFTGTSVRWIGSRGREGGIALLRVDGGPPREVDLFARVQEVRTPIITLYGLSSGEHTLTVEVTGRRHSDADSSVVVVDAFEVEPQIVSHRQESDPDATFSGAGWTTLHESIYSGGGVRTVPDPAIGGAKFTEAAGDKATFRFRGTSIAWIGYRGPDAGIALVQVDGGEAVEVDLFARNQKFQELVFKATGLADASHTLTIQATGRKNEASKAAKVFVDAFDVTTPGRRFQERERTTYAGVWNHGHSGRVWSEGRASTSNVAGSTVTFSFTGTSVTWIGCQKSSCGGRARVYIDGAFVKEVNNHRPIPIEAFQYPVFRADGLSNGPHTLMIEVVSNGNYTVIDAFDVLP
jgi:hypothetical protein